MTVIGYILIIFAVVAALAATVDAGGLAALLYIGAAVSLGIGTGLIGIARALRLILAELRRANARPATGGHRRRIAS